MAHHALELTPADAARRHTLRRYQAFVTALLAVAAVIFLTCSWYQAHLGYTPVAIGYIRAAAEAGMVGGLADWFAVTALFRHPMGIPIPHTALVPKKKDQLGEALSEFVGENFLNAELITEKVSSANIPERTGRWLSQPTNAEKVSHEAGKLTANILKALDPQDAHALIRHQVVDKAAEPLWGPPAGRLLEGLIAEGKTEPVVQEVCTWAHRKVLGMESTIVRMIDERMPQWAPQFAKSLVGDKVYREMVGFTGAVATDPTHEARRAITRFIDQLAEDLQNDPATIARVEGLKADAMASGAVEALPAEIWERTASSLIDAAGDPDSLLRRKITELAVTWGDNIQNDPNLRKRLDRRLTATSAFLADNYAGEITAIISETVQRWDADEATEKIELMVGKDLQFIRLNGTIVGSLAGLVIYAVNHALFGI